MTIEQLIPFFGWMSVINIALLFITTLAVMTVKPWMMDLHKQLFGLDEAALRKSYFKYIAQYKILTIMLNIIPYIALKIL